MNLPGSYFDRIYAADPDPWGFESRWYERRKYALTLAALPAERHGRALELGCSIGVLTVALAGRCDSLLAVDVAAAPLARAQARAQAVGLDHVRFERRAVPDQWPVGGPYDLVVLSEMGYYLDEPTLVRLLDRVTDELVAGGHLLAVHWRGPARDYPLSGDRVHEVLGAQEGLVVDATYREADFRLDLLRRT